jgi:PIF1-like helicase
MAVCHHSQLPSSTHSLVQLSTMMALSRPSCKCRRLVYTILLRSFTSEGYRFPLRTEVERANANRLNALGGAEGYTYKAEDSPTVIDAETQRRRKLLENLMAPESLTLKVGAQVMLIRNTDERLVNGSVGTVEALPTTTRSQV